MITDGFVKSRVARYYWKDDINCATATLKILSEAFEIPLNEQVMDAAIGLHGAGEHGAQCGLVEGALIFLGIFGRNKKISDHMIVSYCREFAMHFENRFGSLLCRVLRPEGFQPDNPPHLCESLSCRAIAFSLDFISTMEEDRKQEKFLVSG